jgi:hypothetical protein
MVSDRLRHEPRHLGMFAADWGFLILPLGVPKRVYALDHLRYPSGGFSALISKEGTK